MGVFYCIHNRGTAVFKFCTRAPGAPRGRTTQNTVSYDFPCASPARRVLKTSHTIDTKMGRIRTNMQKKKYKIFNGENIIRQQHKNIKTLKLTRHVPFCILTSFLSKSPKSRKSCKSRQVTRTSYNHLAVIVCTLGFIDG
jgi:hypothetical protein